MSSKAILRLFFVIVAVALVAAPTFVRAVVWGYSLRPYGVGQVPMTSVAATPMPTTTPIPVVADSMLLDRPLRPGPVVVDLAHGNALTRSQFEPLAAALARRGVGLRFWLSDVNVMELTSYLDYPDQSAELAPLLEEASALVVISPFFLWSKDEIALVERFVADGGHLLLISDPDVLGDLAQDINLLGEPFGVVFNDDYLYDTTANDGNYTYILPTEFANQAERLSQRTIALYGARSISGEVTPLVRTANTTLSSLRTGLTSFATLALGGLESRGTKDRVLALSDFDVMTTSYVERHDNTQLVEFVAGFLAAAERRDTITDFPAYLGKEVALIFGNAEVVDAEILLEGARVQRSLELTGRTLNLAGTALLTSTINAGMVGPDLDLIVLADFAMISQETDLLERIGFRRVEILPPGTEPLTATVPLSATTDTAVSALPAAGEKLALSGDEVGGTAALTETLPLTDTQAADPTVEPTPTATPTATPMPPPQPTVYLEKADGLRLVARQTVIIAQLQLSGQHRLVAVLGHDNAGIQNGVERLLSNDYTGCVTGPDQVVCSFDGGPVAEAASPTPTPTPTVEPTAEATAAATTAVNQILVVDDNDMAGPNDTSEADTYLLALTQMGYSPILWSTNSQNIPPAVELAKYRWVIWSSGGYENGGPGIDDLEGLLSYINGGGRLTISSRRPFFAMSTEDPSVIADITVMSDASTLTRGLPAGTFELPNGLPPVTPLEINDGMNGPQVALRRGPDSGDAGAPLLFVAVDEGAPDSTGARLMILGMALTWLPDDLAPQLVQNMAESMLGD